MFVRRLAVLALSLAALCGSSVAIAQPVSAAQPAVPALPDARSIQATCGSLPPIDRPVPPTAQAHLSYIRAGIAANAAFSRPDFPQALALYWEAYAQEQTTEVVERLRATLGLVTATVPLDRRCAIVACLVHRTTGAERQSLEELRNQCNAQTAVHPVPVQTFSLTSEERAALTLDVTLHERSRREGALDIRPGNEWRLPESYRAALDQAVRSYRRINLGLTRPPLTPGRSPLSWALHAAGAGIGVVSLVAAAILGVECDENNQTTEDANAGRTATGVNRDNLATARSVCPAANVMAVVGGAALVATGISFGLTLPRSQPGRTSALGASVTIEF